MPAETPSSSDLATVEQTARRVIRLYCRRYPLPAHTSVDDIVQNTLLSVYRYWDSRPGDASALRPWVAVIARRRAIDIYQRYTFTRSETPMEVLPEAASGGDQVERLALPIRPGLLDGLPSRHRLALSMRAFGQAYTQIAADLRTSRGAARVLVYEARRMLRGLPARLPERRPGTTRVAVDRVRWPAHMLGADLGELGYLVNALRTGQPITPVVVTRTRGVLTVADWQSARRLAAAHLAGVTHVRVIPAPPPVYELAAVDPAYLTPRAHRRQVA